MTALIAFFKAISPLVYLWTGIIAICFTLGAYVGYGCHKCPTIDPGGIRVVDSVQVHDTLRDTVQRDRIVVKKEIITQYLAVHDTVQGLSVVITQDIAPCYSMAKREPDGASITAELCSRVFPVERPTDLVGHIEYIPAPDTQRTIYRMDTISRPHLWRDIKICGVTVIIAGGLGYVAAKLLK